MINNKELAAYAKAQIGRPYWFGTFGQIATSKLLSTKAAQYPKQYSATRQKKAQTRGDIGQKVHDCIGLAKGASWSKGRPDMPAIYNAAEDLSADAAFNKAEKKGPISTIPEIEGLGVYRKGHVGIYMTGGRVVQAKGFDYGVIESDLEGFTDWFEYPFIEYSESGNNNANAEEDTPAGGTVYTVQKGDTLTAIAKKYNTTVSAIASENKIANPNLIQIGQKINIPTGGASEQEPKVWTGTVATQRDPLNVRAGRGKQYKILRQLPRGSTAKIRGEAIDGWLELDAGGFVAAEFIK